tara:strand:+ start:25120 stop:27498 length:2379 start_codon:yes stop_codon:yes gene_type:complete
MNKLLVLFMLVTTALSAQDNYTLSGTIKEASNGETAFGASVFLKGTTIGVMSNEYGFYSITAPKDTYTLVVSYIGFNDKTLEITLNKNQKVDFEITEASTQLDEIVITTSESEQTSIRDPQMSVTKVKMSTIKKMPVVFGEVDIIKSIQTLPGVTNNGESSGGFNVRGGTVDQNLVLLDEAIIYNTSHLLGFFSVFNADAIKDVKLYKGGIPARFGGRVSSVLDVRQKDGNNKEYKFTGGVGLISSRLAIEGPIVKDKGSFLIAGRGSYAHLFLKLQKEEERTDNSASFYDLNLKTNYSIDQNNKIYISGYLGRDNINFDGGFASSYGNLSGNLRWNHIFNDRLFSNASLIYSKYDYELEFRDFEFDWIASIRNYNAKYDLKYYASDVLKLDFGLNTIYYGFEPGEINPTTDYSSINPLELDQKRAFESGLYLNAEHKITQNLTAQYGLRYSNFSRLGGQTLNNYENNQPVVYNERLGLYEEGTIIGETEYTKNETIATFNNLEPRLSISYQLNESSSVKTGYSRTAQYIHLLSNTSSVSPLDVWTPSGKFIKPQLADQYALGYFKNIKNNSYSLETEVYYKTVDNRIDYVDGSELVGQNAIETEILSGESRGYGLEILLRKTRGDFTGWLSYTLSKSEQRTPGGTAGGPGINSGNWYNSSQDRTHDISFTGSYSLNEKWTLGTNFVFQTGRPATYPDAQYEYEGVSVATFSDRNSQRLASYHRLDISTTYAPNKHPESDWKGEWVFGIYNVYNRKNAASVSFGQNKETGMNEATRTSIFGMVPSFSYNFKF